MQPRARSRSPSPTPLPRVNKDMTSSKVLTDPTEQQDDSESQIDLTEFIIIMHNLWCVRLYPSQRGSSQGWEYLPVHDH